MDFNYDTETITPDQTGMITIGGLQGLEIPAGLSADRPVSPIVGVIRINTDLADAKFEYWDGTTWVQPGAGSGGSGTVTSVAAQQPTAGLTITGSPITTSGTLTFALANDLAAVEGLSTTGIVRRTGTDTWTAGGNISLTTEVTGVLPSANGGTGLSAIGTSLQVLRVNSAGTALEYATPANGTVTSVSATQPAAGLTITGSPITTSGTLTFTLANDLGAIETLNGTGFYTRIGTDTWAARTITGTTNQIAVNAGTGVAGNPVIAIANNPILPGTGGTVVPSGTTAERPVSPTNGTIRYNTTTGKIEMFQNGFWITISGSTTGRGIINIYTGPIPAASGNASVPWDNTAPDVTEGSEIWTFTVTPTSLTSEFKLTVPFTADCGSSNRIVITSLFRNGINIGSALFFATGGGRPTTTTLSVSDTPNTISPVTYSMRTGVGAGNATWYVNSTSSGNDLGGALISTWQITEVA